MQHANNWLSHSTTTGILPQGTLAMESYILGIQALAQPCCNCKCNQRRTTSGTGTLAHFGTGVSISAAMTSEATCIWPDLSLQASVAAGSTGCCCLCLSALQGARVIGRECMHLSHLERLAHSEERIDDNAQAAPSRAEVITDIDTTALLVQHCTH